MSDPAPSQPPKEQRKLYTYPEGEFTPDELAEMFDPDAPSVELTAEEVAEMEATGQFPASVEARIAALECDESRT